MPQPLARCSAYPAITPLIVVMGGSQGAHAINEALRVDLKRLLEVAHVVHVSGQRDFQPLTVERDRLPAALRTRYHLHDFIHQGFADLLAAADIVVSRAGATSVAELSAVGTAAVLIPGAFGAGHQIATAEAMARRKRPCCCRSPTWHPGAWSMSCWGRSPTRDDCVR